MRELSLHDCPDNLEAPFLKHGNIIAVHPHRHFYHDYLKKLNGRLNTLLADNGMEFRLSFCFTPENPYNIILEPSLVEKLYKFLVSEGCLLGKEEEKHNFRLLFNNRIIYRDVHSVHWIRTTARSKKPSNISLRTLFLALSEKTGTNLLDLRHRQYYESIFIAKDGSRLSLENKGDGMTDSYFEWQLKDILRVP